MALAAGVTALCAASARFIVWPCRRRAGKGRRRGRPRGRGRRTAPRGGAARRARRRARPRPLARDGLRAGGTGWRSSASRRSQTARRVRRVARAGSPRSAAGARIVVVTSRYHASRTRMLFERCFPGEVRVVGARPDSPGGLPSARNLGPGVARLRARVPRRAELLRAKGPRLDCFQSWRARFRSGSAACRSGAARPSRSSR